MGNRQKTRAAYRRLAYVAVSAAADMAETSKNAEELQFWMAIQDLIESRYSGIESASDGMTRNAALNLLAGLEP